MTPLRNDIKTACESTAKIRKFKTFCIDFINKIGIPKVFTKSNKVLKINPKAFASYDDIKLQDEFSIENGGTKYTPIADMDG